MNIVCLSDTHGMHRLIDKQDIPDGDVLIHAGDWSRNSNTSAEDLKDLDCWFGELAHKYKIVIAGNHDTIAEEIGVKETMEHFTNAHYLCDSSVDIDGIKFWGTPWTPIFFDWHFMDDEHALQQRWLSIPESVDVLISHGPAKGILDQPVTKQHVGSSALLQVINCIRPQCHIFGHIHESYGIQRVGKRLYVNASVLDGHYHMRHTPILVSTTAKGE